MAQVAPAQHSPSSAPRRPKGILKNSTSFYNSPPDTRMSPTPEQTNFAPLENRPEGAQRPSLPHQMSEKEIVQMNTEINAGEAGQRRNSSNPRGSIGQRQSSHSSSAGRPDGEIDESGTRLKWDEANLYLNEGQMGGKMKIDEPKTPFAKNYDPTEDEDEVETLNAQELAVDELDMHKTRKTGRSGSGAGAKMADIPGLDLGEPQLEPSLEGGAERKVHVDSDYMDVDGSRHGEDVTANMTSEEKEKHKKFEEMRKKHYEMKNIKDLLGHPDAVDSMEDDGDE